MWKGSEYTESILTDEEEELYEYYITALEGNGGDKPLALAETSEQMYEEESVISDIICKVETFY